MKKSSLTKCRSVCPIACALDVLGDRWTFLVIRDLFLNKHEFGEFLAGPEGIATNILSDRLKRLVCCDIIAWRQHPEQKTKKQYYLTPKGKDLGPILIELILWGAAYHSPSGMPKSQLEKLKRDPKKFLNTLLDTLRNWEKASLK